MALIIGAGRTNDINNELVALIGADSKDSVDLGSFDGATIPDNSSVKDALQELETAVEAATGSGIGEAPTDGGAYVRKDSQWVDSFDFGIEVAASKTLSYNGDGKLTGITGASVSKTLTYDANGRLQTLVATKGSTTITKTFTYDVDGILNQITVS